MTTIDLSKPGPAGPPDPDRPTTPADRAPTAALTGTRKPRTLDTSKPIRPAWQQDVGTAYVTFRLFAHRNLYRARKHLYYLPVYVGLLLMFSPRGLARVVALASRWAYDADSAGLRHAHAGNTETPEYAKAHAVRKANLRARGLVILTGAVVLVAPVLVWWSPVTLATIVAPALFLWVVRLIPGHSVWEYVVAACLSVALWFLVPQWCALVPQPPIWPFLLAAVPAVLALGWIGRNRDKAIVKPTDLQAGGIVEPIRAPMVTAALCTLGNTKMTEKSQDDPRTAIRLLMDVARQGAGYQVDLELPPGVPASFVQDKREQLAAALRRELGCVFPSVGPRHPGHLSLYISDVPMSKAAQAPWPLAKGEAVSLFDALELFTNNVGAWVKQRIAYTAWVCGAVPRMGKTFFVRQFGLVAGLDVRSKVLAFDLKGTGDLSPLALFAHAYSVGDEPEDIAIQLEHMRWVRAEMRKRTKYVRELTLEENPEKGKVTDALATKDPKKFGPIVICVDECQVWFEELDDKAMREEFTAICRDLIKRGPALGIIPLFATQKPDAKSIPTAIADNASARVCFKVNGQVSNDQVLGTSSYQAGLRATQFGFEDKGVAYFRGDGADALIVRTVHDLDATAAEVIAAKARALRQSKGLLTGDAAGELMDMEALQVDLMEDVRFVFQGADKMTLTDIREGLAMLRETLYGHLDNDALGAMLRQAGVEPGPVWVGGKTSKGVKREQCDVSTTAVLGIVPDPDEDDGAA